MVAKYDKEQKYSEKLNERRRREVALDRQQEIQKQFLLQQIDELAADFVDHPEQIGHYIADLEAAGMLQVADKGMLFRRLWETMGPAFADRAFNMSERAVFESDDLARSIADDVAHEKKSTFEADRAKRTVAPEHAEELDHASAILLSLSRALGLDLDLAPTPPAREHAANDAADTIVDPDHDRAAKTRELLDVLGPQLDVDTDGLEVKVDEEARYRTATQGLYGLMADGTVFLNPDVYDPETAAGRGLLAHEVSHIAQRENMLRGVGEYDASVPMAETEADNISEMFAEGGPVRAPLASLAMYDQAACAPQSSTPEKTPEKPVEPTTEIIVEPPTYEIVENEIKVPEIQFPFDEPGRAIQGKSSIDAPGYAESNHPALRGLITTVATFPEITGISITSHTDHRGSNAYNMALSGRRAAATREWLGAPSDGGAALTVKVTSAIGKGETAPKNASQFADGRDLNEAQHRENRRSEFRITEVNGQAHSGPFKPTKKILVQPGRVVIRYLDKDGNVIKEEVLGEGQQPAGLSSEEQAQAGGTPTGGAQASQAQVAAPAPVSAGGGGGGGCGGGGGGGGGGGAAVTSTPSQAGQTSQATPSTTTGAVPKSTGGRVYSQRDKVNRRKKLKVPYRYATPSILGSVGQPGIHDIWQAKAGPGGLSSGQISERTRANGGGEALSGELRTRFESAFGQDFSDVRIHRGSAAASSVGATAFARGQDIHFAPGRFDAASQSGLDVLGHELTHIVQQRAGRVAIPQNKGLNVNIDRSLEGEADLLGARAARGERVAVGGSAAGLLRRQDTVQYLDGAGAAPAATTAAEAPKTECELFFGGQKFTARAPQGITPGVVRVDFGGAELHGVRIGAAQIEFDQNSQVLRGTVSASVSVGTFVEANDVQLSVERRDVGGRIEGHVSADIRGARLNISELFETTMDLTVASDGVSGRAQVDANAPITLGEGITLTSGALTVTLEKDGTVGVSGAVVGEVTGLGTVTITATAISDGHLSGNIAVTLANPLPVPGVEGVTIERLSLGGEYIQGQSWTVNGSVGLNVRDWVGADITGSYTHQMGEEGGEGASSSWQVQGQLIQLQPFTLGEGEEALTLSNGTLDVLFQDGAFVRTEAGVDYETTNWRGHVGGTYLVQEQLLDATGTIEMKVEELPLGDTGARVTRVNGQLTLVQNVLTELSGAVTAIFPYEEQDTFEITGEGLTFNIPEMKASGSATVRTMRELGFGDVAAYNAKVAENATATLTVADNTLQGITGGLAFSVAYGQDPIGEGTIDVSFEGETNALNALATFTLTAENGFGVPDRVNGPVMLKPGGTFMLSIENSQLALAQVTALEYEVKQVGEGATGVITGTIAGSYDFRTGMLNASGNGALTAPWPLAPAEGVNLTFKEGGNLSIVVTENVLTQVQGAFPFDATIAARESIPELVLEGELSGDYSQETGLFNGALKAQLKQAVPIPLSGEGNVLTVKEGAELNASVSNSTPGLLQVSFDADYTRAGELFLQGHVDNASYNFGTGDFDFTGSLTLKKDIEKQTDDGKWKFVVKEGSTVGVEVAQSQLVALTGQIPFEVHDAEGALLKGSLNDARLEVEELKFSGTLDVALGRDMQYPRTAEGGEGTPEGSPPVSMVAKKDVSHVTGRIEQNVFQEATATLAFGVNLGGEEYGAGELSGSWDVQANRFSGTGDITLVKNLFIGDERRTAAGGTALESWILGFAAGQGLSIAIANNVLDAASVNLGCVLFHNLEPVATGNVNGRYKLGETESFEGSADVSVIKNLDFSEGPRFHYWIEEGTTAQVAFAGTTVNSASGTFRLLMKETEKDKVRVTLGASYTPGTGFSAAGQIEVLDDIPMAENGDYKFSVAKGSGGGAAVTGKEVTSFNGELTVLVDKGQDPFAKGTFTLDYQLADSNPVINATGSVELLSRVELGSLGEWKFFVMPSTGVSLGVVASELDSLGGTIELEAQKVEGTPFAKLTLSGQYSKAAGFGGQGTAELLTEYKVIDTPIGNETYSLWVMPGTGATITLAGSDITLIGGQVIAMIRDADGPGGNFIQVDATGVSYGYKDKNFSGTGNATILKDKKLATFGESEELWLAQGSGANATVAGNVLQQVGGAIQLKLRDAEGFYIQCGLAGSFDAAGGTGFTGEGSATITRLKELGRIGSYVFFLDLGAGATAHIEQNKLTQVDGQVPFQVHDAEGLLIRGQAEGNYRTEEKKFSGTGGVFLGRDIEYQIGDIKLVFKEGSGGSGTVTDNELRKLGGTLNVDIHDADGAMINVNASGEFDAVEKKLLWVEGGASLLRPISVGGEGDNAILRITTLSGSARVENNELKWIRGKLGFEAPRLLNMHGEVEGGWEATGGQDVFYGSGWVDFTIFDEPAQGRFMKGKADFTYNKDETWNIGGEVDYQLNEMIGGKVRVDVDQTLDPVIGGELRVENVKLIEGRDLFKWGKDFPLLRTTIMAGPVPIDINGGVGIGIALSMLPLTFSTTIGFTGWRPLSAATKVPDFTARADLNTGVRLTAALKPWLGIGIGVSGVCSAGLRLQGEVGLNVDANINPFAELKGEGGVYSGKLGLGVNVVGSGSLGITPQVYATLGQTWTHDLANITHDLGQLFSLDYNFAFPFGDQPAAPEQGAGGAAPATTAAAQTTKTAGAETKPAMPAETQGAARKPGALKGGPDLNQADNQEETKAKQDGPMGELMAKIDSVQEWGAKVGALAKVGGQLISMLTFMVTIPPPFGIAAAGIYLAYQLLSGGLTFEDIVTAAKTVWEIVGMIGEAVLAALPDWLVKLWNQIKGKSWDQLLGDLIQNMANWLIDLFPSARRVIQGLADMAKGILSSIARVIRKIINGGFGFDDFIDLCRDIGGALLGLIAELVGEAVVEAVSDAAGAVVDFICDPPW